MKKGIAELPLHYGKTPRWLFDMMKKLSREIILFIVKEYSEDEALERLSDPFWFQAFGSVLGFDWHSSGVTTTVCGALKEGLNDLKHELGIFICGGKGKTSKNTPQEITNICERISFDPHPLIYASKLTAKVDNTCIQDGYQLYHHVFIFTKTGKWVVIQQGMNPLNGLARRYHWYSPDIKEMVNEPHKAICCDHKVENVLNLVAKDSSETRDGIIEISGSPYRLLKDILILQRSHYIDNFSLKNFEKKVYKIYYNLPKKFEELLMMQGIGPKSLRALAMISNLIYGTKLSWRDPVKYSFAHGGKDGIPYPVDKSQYISSINFLERALSEAKIGYYEKMRALRRLKNLL